jgi:hypothetical protein
VAVRHERLGEGGSSSGNSRGTPLATRARHVGFLRQIDRAGEFLRLAEPLGVTDVRVAGTCDRLYVFVAIGRTDEELTAIKLLARGHWPDRQFELVYRSPIRESGETPVVREDEDVPSKVG